MSNQLSTDSSIQHVSDTSLWVAHFRAKESERSDALFSDPYAKALIGERGKAIAEDMARSGAMVEWTVVIRTYIIDNYIRELVQSGFDTIINMGAGMDTRPYRLDLPAQLKWIEVDFPHVIEHKKKILDHEKPKCDLQRFGLDLSNRQVRQDFLHPFNHGSKRVAVLTEGVIPYLTEAQVADLAADLYNTQDIKYWIAEYISASTYPYLKNKKRQEKLKNSPFVFFPPDWLDFFKQQRWNAKEMRYAGEMSVKLGRPILLPWWVRAIVSLAGAKAQKQLQQSSAYVLFEKAPPTI